MSYIEKYITPFIESQFPSFYREEGRDFIAFVEAYFEWLEKEENVIGQSRKLLNNIDIDESLQDFIKHFKNQYVKFLPDDIKSDKKLVYKHILDLYEAKGTPRAIKLLFRIIYGEDIDINIPNEKLFTTSDNIWYRPYYIEVEYNEKLEKLLHTEITTVGNTAYATVSSIGSRIVKNREIYYLLLSNIKGTFKSGDRIYQVSEEHIKKKDAILIVGSLTAVAITSGGKNYSVGDILDIEGTGVDGKAIVSEISEDFKGAVDFKIVNGGSGYTLSSNVTVKTTIELELTNVQGTFSNNTSLVSNNNANGTICAIVTPTRLRLIDFSTTPEFLEGHIVQTTTGNGIISGIFGGTGTGASFKVGSITNKELITYYSDTINTYASFALDANTNTYRLEISNTSGTFAPSHTVNSSANVIYLTVSTLTSTQVANGESLSNSTLGIANLYVWRSDGHFVYVTGPESQLNNANLAVNVILVSNSTSSQILLNDVSPKVTSNGQGIIISANSTAIVVNSNTGYFVETATLQNANVIGTATITNVVRLTDWNFPNSVVADCNLDSLIEEVLTLTTKEVGTIASLKNINPGKNYITKPHVIVKQQDIAQLLLYDSVGQKGNNAIIETNVSDSKGAITAVEILNSGYGYFNNENVTLVSEKNDTIAEGVTIVQKQGITAGQWLNRKSFSSDINHIFDGEFYQYFSYEIISERLLESYKNFLYDLVHPLGYAVFSRYRNVKTLLENVDIYETKISKFINYNDIIVFYVNNLHLDEHENTFDLVVANTNNFFVNNTVSATANAVYLQGNTLTSATISNGDILSNSSLGIANLYVWRSDGHFVYVTGPESQLNNANLAVDTILTNNTNNKLFKITLKPSKHIITGNGIIETVNSTTIRISSNNGGYFIPTANLINANTSANTVINNTIRLTNWNIYGNMLSNTVNLDTILNNAIPSSVPV